MKKIILSLLSFASVYAFGQNNSTTKTVDLNAVGNLVANKATVLQVIDKFGEATQELVRPENALLDYKINGNEYLFKFDETKKLNNFIFDNQSKNSTANLSYADIKQARDFKTKAEIQNKLGQPNHIIINDENETWYYTVGEETSPQKTLIIRFELTAPTIVKSYNYYADFDNSKSFSSDAINSFIKGSTSSADVENKLGKPSKIILSNEKEDWYYMSKNSTLIVYFDKQSKVNDFLYSRGSDETK
jgi:outer membrane protein assembly factor BamE (lipoprotein component of BamABCDE complex)